MKHGKGKEYYKNGNIKHEGDFAFGKFEGNGKYFYENGDCHIGYFVNGKKMVKEHYIIKME